MKKRVLFCLVTMTVFLGVACSKAEAPLPGQPVSDKLEDKMVINLYDGAAPGSENPKYAEATFGDADNPTTVNVSKPTLTVYLPENPNGTSMIVCPGGAFLGLGMKTEGENPARELNKQGITCFVLKYRLSPLAQDNGKAPGNVMEMGLTMLKRMEEALQRYKDTHNGAEPNVTQICSMFPEWDNAFVDADKAIELVRQHAGVWNLNPEKIGIMGFSAGGITSVHQAMTHSKLGKPNFAASFYGGWGLTNDIKAPEDACPLWMCSPVNDLLAPDESYNPYLAWRDAKVPTELHTFWDCKHGFGVPHTGKGIDQCMDMLIQFMRDVEFLK